jgi:hypothetical protein
MPQTLPIHPIGSMDIRAEIRDLDWDAAFEVCKQHQSVFMLARVEWDSETKICKLLFAPGRGTVTFFNEPQPTKEN